MTGLYQKLSYFEAGRLHRGETEFCSSNIAETMVTLPSHLLPFPYVGKALPHICTVSETVYVNFKAEDTWNKTQPKDKECNLHMENWNGGTGLWLKCYLDDSLHKKGSVFGFSLWVTSRAHCDKKMSNVTWSGIMWTNYHSIALHYRTVIGSGVSAWDGVAEENWVVIDNMIKTVRGPSNKLLKFTVDRETL